MRRRCDRDGRDRIGQGVLGGLLVLGVLFPAILWAQVGSDEATETTEEETPASAYHESALRRFEIVTLTALPFTAIHSYLIVRGVKIAQEGNFAAGIKGSDWNAVGAVAIGFAVGIGVYDYLRMRGKDRSAPLLPETPPPRSTGSFSSGSGGLVPLAALSVRF